MESHDDKDTTLETRQQLAVKVCCLLKEEGRWGGGVVVGGGVGSYVILFINVDNYKQRETI